jgi:hypothetical protein
MIVFSIVCNKWNTTTWFFETKSWQYFLIYTWFFVVVGSCQWGETMSLNCGHQQAYCSSSSWYEYGERWWNGVDRRKPKNSENLYHCHFVYYKSHMDYPVSNPASMVRRQRLTAWTVAWPKFFFIKNCVQNLGSMSWVCNITEWMFYEVLCMCLTKHEYWMFIFTLFRYEIYWNRRKDLQRC